MTATPTAALWREIIVLGLGCMLLPVLAVIAALANPPYTLWAFTLGYSLLGAFDWMGLLGVGLVAVGLWLGRGYGWRRTGSG